MTGFVPVMWLVWGGLLALLVGLKVYAIGLTRDEDDQIILDDSFDNVKNEQAAMLVKVNRIAPLERVMMWLVVAMTVVVISYYIVDFVRQFD